MDKKEIGKIGEKCAKKFLLSREYKILDSNYSSRFGEIDIIAQQNNTIVFFEVKTRTGNKYGEGEESVGKDKIGKILKTAYKFIETNGKKKIDDLRIDLIVIKLDGDKKPISLKHIKNITDG